MSSLLRPVGHLPASVYWVRRALVLVVLVVLTVALLRLFGGGGEDPKNSSAPGPQQSSTPTPTGGSSSTPTPSSSADKESPRTTRPRDGNCDGTDVRISVLPGARQIVTGGALNLTVRLGAARDQCTAKVDATRLSLTITSGNDQIWSTSQCRQLIPQATLILAKGKESSSTVVWNGRRSGPGCLPGQPAAKPGTYVVVAAYDGRASTAQAFQIRAA